MKPSSKWAIQTLTFPKTEAWHAFAAQAGIAPDFYLRPGMAPVEQPVTCAVLSVNAEVYAVAPLFTHSRECGLWVTPSQRKHGLGRLVLSGLLTNVCSHLYAAVSLDNTSAKAMEHLLTAFDFQYTGTAGAHRIWQHRPKQEVAYVKPLFSFAP